MDKKESDALQKTYGMRLLSGIINHLHLKGEKTSI